MNSKRRWDTINKKDRIVRVVRQLGCTEYEALEGLENTGWDIDRAVDWIRRHAKN